MAQPAITYLTQQKRKNTSGKRDRPECSFEVTPEMVQRATKVLWDSGRLYAIAEGTDQLVVRKMLEAGLGAKVRERTD